MNHMNFEAGGNTYKLVLTTRAMVELEKKIGCNPLDILVKVQSEESLPKVYDMVAIIWASLLKFNHGIKFDDCYDIFDDYLNEGHAITDFLEVMLEIFKVSGLIKEDKEGQDPNAQKEEEN